MPGTDTLTPQAEADIQSHTSFLHQFGGVYNHIS